MANTTGLSSSVSKSFETARQKILHHATADRHQFFHSATERVHSTHRVKAVLLSFLLSLRAPARGEGHSVFLMQREEEDEGIILQTMLSKK